MEKHNKDEDLPMTAKKDNNIEHQINKSSLQNQIIACSICSFSGFVMGASSTWLSPCIKILQSSDGPLSPPMTSKELGWAGSLICLGGLLGMPMFNWVVRNKGRKAAAYSVGLPFAVGFGLKLIANKSWILLLARFLCGIGGSGAMSLPPIYVGECSEPRIRGVLSTLVTFSLTVGMLTSFSIGTVVSYYTFTSILLSLPLLYMLAFWFMPETPAFRLRRGQEEEAARAVAWLRKLPLNSAEVRAELVSIARQIRGVHDTSEIYLQPTREELNREMEYIHAMNRAKDRRTLTNHSAEPKPKSPWTQIKESKSSRRGVSLVVFLCFGQNFVGTFAVSMYAQMIFDKAGTKLSPEICSVIYGIVVISGTALALVLMDIAGRKILQVLSCVMIIVGELIFAIYYHCEYNGMLEGIPKYWSWLALISLFVSVLCYNIGPATVPFVLISEFFLVEVRDLATTLSLVGLWLGGFILLLAFPPLVEIFSLHIVFYFFAGATFVLGLVSFIFLPETKGKTVLEIQKLLVK